MTVGSPPSTTATTEFVVPRSIPITFAMSSLSCLEVSRQRRARRGSESRRRPAALLHVDLDLLGLYRLHLRQRHGEHAVAVRRPNLVRLYGDGELKDSLHAPGPSLSAEVLLGLHGLGLCALALEAQQVAGDGHLHVLLAHARKVDLDHQLVLGLVHVRRRRPGTVLGSGGSAEECIEQPADLGLHLTKLSRPYPRLQHLLGRIRMHYSHNRASLQSGYLEPYLGDPSDLSLSNVYILRALLSI